MEYLYVQFEGKYDLLTSMESVLLIADFSLVGHAGHCGVDLTGERLFTLEDQIQHKCDFLKSFTGTILHLQLLSHILQRVNTMKALALEVNQLQPSSS